MAASITTEVQVAEPHVLEWTWLRDRSHRDEVTKVIEHASLTGLLHIANHGLDPSLFQKIRELTIKYMSTTSMEQKDRDSMQEATGYFEGYKPRTKEQKELGVLASVEEYNYDYHDSGTVIRPQIFRDNEDIVRKVFDFYHKELTPRLLEALNGYCGREPGELVNAHRESSEVAHMLLYRPQWYLDGPRKRAAYSGHTDIGSLTYLAANPVRGLQVYGKDGWKDVAYEPNSIVVLMGDAMEYMTDGRMNGTLHRVVKPSIAQDNEPRPSLIFFVHPNHATMSASLQHVRDTRRNFTMQSKLSPGCPIDRIGLNRVVGAISARKEDLYHAAVDPETWVSAKRGGWVSSPPGVCIDYDDLTIELPDEAAPAAGPRVDTETEGIAV